MIPKILGSWHYLSGDIMEDRRRLEELITEINLYKSQADILNQQLKTIEITISELKAAEDALDAIEKKERVETLVPIGAGSFLITEIKNTDEVIVGLGAGVAAKKKIEDAKKSITEQKAELEKAMTNMAKELQELTERIIKLSPEADELLKRIRESEG